MHSTSGFRRTTTAAVCALGLAAAGTAYASAHAVPAQAIASQTISPQTIAARTIPSHAARASAATTIAAASQQLAPFGWLVGGAWRADTSTLPGGLKYIETRYDLAPNGRVIRFTTAFVNGDGSVGNGYAGNLYFDPAGSTLKMWYVDSKNAITQGPVTGDGRVWHMDFQGDGVVIGRSGLVDFRVEVTRETNDAYAWVLYERHVDVYKALFSLRYVRTPDRTAG